MEAPKRKPRNALGAAAAAMLALNAQEAPAQEPFSERNRIGEFSRNVAGPSLEKPRSRIDISRNQLSPEEVRAHRDEAIRSLIEDLPTDPQLDHLRNDTERLQAESEAYAPDEAELRMVLEKSREQLIQLADDTPPGDYGVFPFADIGPNGQEIHRVYVLQKLPSGTVEFVKAYRVSMAEKGFGNKKDSNQTPLGEASFLSGHEGLYGEVVTVEKKALPHFKRIVRTRDGVERRFVSDFGNFPFMEPASVITDRYTIDEQRGIHFHGSNRTGQWRMRGGKKVWESYINLRNSGACIRMANADVRDLGRRYIKLPVRQNGRIIKKGTPVFIHATPEVLRKHAGEQK